MILRGIIQAITGRTVSASTYKGEAQGDILRVEPMGLSSTPSGGDAIIASINGDASRRVLLAIVRSDTPVAGDGETILFDPSGAFRIVLSDGGIEISGDPDKITIGGKRVARVGDRTSDGARII